MKAQSSPNSCGVPNRLAGMDAIDSAAISSSDRPDFWAANAMPERSRSVSKRPGRMLLMVTLRSTVWRASPATKPVRPERAPLDRPSCGIGALTELEVTLTIRPKPRSRMPSTTALISMIAVIMLALQALIQSCSSHSRKSPGGGPPALLTRISTCGQAASAAARPSGVVMSPATVLTTAPVSRAIWSAAASSAAWLRAVIVTATPFRASARAQPRPSPLLAAQTRAFLPAMPRSIGSSLSLRAYGRVRALQIGLPEHGARQRDRDRAMLLERARIERCDQRPGRGERSLHVRQHIADHVLGDDELTIAEQLHQERAEQGLVRRADRDRRGGPQPRGEIGQRDRPLRHRPAGGEQDVAALLDQPVVELQQPDLI